MAGITLRTARQVVPMIYAYTTPEIARHNGWTKIGYTEQSVDKRLKQQTHTADVLFHEEWRGNAVYDDGSGEVFTDHDFHAYLRKLNVENDRKNEWFHLDGQQSRRYFQDFRMTGSVRFVKCALHHIFHNERCVCGVLAAVVADTVLMGTAYWAVTYEPELLQVITPEVMLIVCASVLVFGIVITWLCAYVSINKYLRMRANSLYYI